MSYVVRRIIAAYAHTTCTHTLRRAEGVLNDEFRKVDEKVALAAAKNQKAKRMDIKEPYREAA
jgi:hypothetical protein